MFYILACGPPTSPSDATYLPDKDQYGLGEEVIFTCTATGDQVKQTCSTTGNWLPRLQYICGGKFWKVGFWVVTRKVMNTPVTR